MEVNNNNPVDDVEQNHPAYLNMTGRRETMSWISPSEDENLTWISPATDEEGNHPNNTNIDLVVDLDRMACNRPAEDEEGNSLDLSQVVGGEMMTGNRAIEDEKCNSRDFSSVVGIEKKTSCRPIEDKEGNHPDNTTNDRIVVGEKVTCNNRPAQDEEGNCLDHTDLTLIVGGEKMACSRDKLSRTSDYFKAMFDSNMKESTSNCISLEQVDPEAMRIILDFLVTGRLDLTQENVHIVTEAACMFQIKLVINQCCELMEDLLNDDNCLAILSLAHTFALEELFLKAKRHSLWYFSDVVHTSNFVDIDIHLLCQILLDRKLVVESEMKVYNAIEKWVSHDITVRKAHLKELLPLIRKETLTDEEISTLKQKLLIQDYQHVFDNLDTSAASEIKKYRQIPYCLWSLGGQDDPYDDDIYASDDEPDVEPPPKILKLSDIDTTCTFESVGMDEQDHPSVIQQETGYSVCVCDKDVYVSGGLTSLGPGRNSWLMDVWKLDTFTAVWEVVTQLRSPRRHHTMITVGDSLILLGGFGKYRMKLKTCEEFNIKTGEWKDLPPMPEESFLIAACATSSNRIYAFKSHAFYYDLGSDHWTKVASSIYSIRKLVPSSAIYIPSKDCVFIISRYHKDLVRFDLGTQTLTTVGQFRYGEAVSNAVAHRGRLYRFSAPLVNHVLEWYDIIKEEFCCRSEFVNGISVLNFHLLPIPDMLDEK
ncbi:kelch-like protein 28 [Ylistrum balloti]|uniref:kelch-like protein 28 n=1 Tax=Ylistrum balloti TaxID=509963 RepID=UPI00290590BA|nr:kelch-like protein 28 [Ylistrum balloti]